MSQSIGLGDVVTFVWDDAGYNSGTICKVYKDGSVDVFRPYTHTADFSMSGGEDGATAVLCYVGVETVKNLSPLNFRILKKHSGLK